MKNDGQRVRINNFSTHSALLRESKQENFMILIRRKKNWFLINLSRELPTLTPKQVIFVVIDDIEKLNFPFIVVGHRGEMRWLNKRSHKVVIYYQRQSPTLKSKKQ